MSSQTSARHILLLLIPTAMALTQTPQDYVLGNLIQFNDNGLWCWFQDERAVVDRQTHKVILGSDASGTGVGGSAHDGNIEAVIFDLNSRTPQRYLLADMGCDDHNVPGFIIRPDGKYLALYSAHYDYYKNRYRIFDGSSWSPERAYDWTKRAGGIDYTIAYNNVYYLSAENRMYNFTRANHRSPNFIISSDWGDTWTWGGQLTTNSSNNYNKGYYKYWSNGVDRIDFIFTEQHPRDTLTSIYHGYISGGKAYRSDGVLVDPDIFDTTFIPTYRHFTKVFGDGTIIGTDTLHRCWQSDLVRYADGTIAALITAHTSYGLVGGYSTDPQINPQHAFIYCRYDGTGWSYTYLGQAGYKFYSSEADYVGLGALSPDNPNVVYISTHFDPRDDASLAKREIFKGTTSDRGKSWVWTPITWNSTRDNIRPIIPDWDEHHELLLWCRGSYTSAQSFDAAVVGIITTANAFDQPMTYIDADLNNTTLFNGSPVNPTGPNPDQGAVDDKWHIRTSYGNNGTVFTSAERGGENAPLLKTTIALPEPGSYDLWANFWANPTADWRIKAGLASDRLQLFRHMACKQVDAGCHIGTITLTGGGNTYLYQAYIGRVEVGVNCSVTVYIDDEAIAVGTNSLVGNTARTWYDGISYRLVQDSIPAPVFALARNHIDFGTVPVDSTISDSLLIYNRGNATLTISTIVSSNTAFQVSPTYLILEPYQSAFIRINFTPPDTNRQTGYLICEHNAVGSPDTIFVMGQGKLLYLSCQPPAGPNRFSLAPNFPNPFNAITTISFSIPTREWVDLTIWDLRGQEIARLLEETLEPGSYSVNWNASRLPSGVYICRLRCGPKTATLKMLLLK